MFHVKQFSTNEQDQDKKGRVDEAIIKRGMRRIAKIFAGNGVSGKLITLKDWEGDVYTLKGQLSLRAAARVRDEHFAGRRSVGQSVSQGEAVRAAKSYADGLNQQEEFRSAVRAVLRQSPGQGFGQTSEPIVMEQASRSFSEQHNCRPCMGEGKTPCQVCQARGQKSCDKCRGMREGPCYVCKGQGTTHGPNGAQTACYACQGRRTLQCDMCRGTGQIPCPNCQSTGRAICPECQGQGASTLAIHVQVDAIPDFSVESKDLPPRLVEHIERNHGHDLAVQGDIEVQMKAPQAQPSSYYERQASQGSAWVEHYEAECAWAKLSVDLNGQTLSCFLMGRRGRVVDCPDLLDSFLRPTLTRLQEAGKGNRPPAAVLERAARYRIIREILPVLLAKGKRRAAQATRKAYAFGISDHTIKMLLNEVSAVIARMAFWPAWLSCAAAVLGGAVIMAVWFLTPVRAMLLSGAGLPVQFFADIVLFLGLCGAGVLAIRLAEKTYLQKIFRRLKLSAGLLSRLPKAGISEGVCLVGMGAVFVTFLVLTGPRVVPWLAMIGQ